MQKLVLSFYHLWFFMVSYDNSLWRKLHRFVLSKRMKTKWRLLSLHRVNSLNSLQHPSDKTMSNSVSQLTLLHPGFILYQVLGRQSRWHQWSAPLTVQAVTVSSASGRSQHGGTEASSSWQVLLILGSRDRCGPMVLNLTSYPFTRECVYLQMGVSRCEWSWAGQGWYL